MMMMLMVVVVMMMMMMIKIIPHFPAKLSFIHLSCWLPPPPPPYDFGENDHLFVHPCATDYLTENLMPKKRGWGSALVNGDSLTVSCSLNCTLRGNRRAKFLPFGTLRWTSLPQ